MHLLVLFTIISGFNDVWAVYTLLHNAFVDLKPFNVNVVDRDVRTQNTTKDRRGKIQANTGLRHSLWIHLD